MEEMEEFEFRYREAERLLTKYTRTAVKNGNPRVIWDAGRESWFYERECERDGKIRKVLVEVSGRDKKETVWEEQAAENWKKERSRRENGAGETISPDGRWILFTGDHNLYLKERATGKITKLTEDGTVDCEYGCYIDIYSQITVKREGYQEHPLVRWSPDGRYFVTYRADRRKTRKLYLLESFEHPGESLRPRLRSYPCPFAEDPEEELVHYTLYLGNVQEKTLKKTSVPDFLYPIFTSDEKSTVQWLSDSSAFYTTWIARGYQEAKLFLVDAPGGGTREVLTEHTETFLNLGAFDLLDGYGTYQFSNLILTDRSFAFWQSERNGFAHLYRYRLTDQGSICEGDLFGSNEKELIVQKIVRLDEKQKKIYFMGNHEKDCSDPLYYQLYVIGFDGSGLKRLTPEDAVHQVTMGEAGFIDCYSRIDEPPVMVLRDLEGRKIRDLERADVSELLERGYVMPIPFTVSAEDGEMLYGILIPPAHLEKGKKYPVIDYIYGGAQLYNVPRAFTYDNMQNREILGGLQSLSHLGFAGMILDGRGTPGRGMHFHSFSYHNIHGCAGLSDHVYCLKELQEKFPYLDLDRMGIWGNSAGGYATVSALLRYPEVYKAGVASSGNYDQRMYEHSWTERYYGLYDEKLYEQGDITRLAGNLRGKLLLAYGAMDDNVSMSQTLRLCDELNRQEKDYDLLVLPRANHNVPADSCFIRRKMKFFWDHLHSSQKATALAAATFSESTP